MAAPLHRVHNLRTRGGDGMSVAWTDGRITLLHGDCLELDAWLDADVLITDPPYGVGGQLSSGGSSTAVEFGKQEWDADLVARDAALALWGDTKPYAVFGSPRRWDAALEHREIPLIWDKGQVGMGDCSFPWGPGYEIIYVRGGGWSGRRVSAVLKVQYNSTRAKKIGHPTPKPVALMAELVAKAPPGVIADPFAGSGSTLLAARMLGREAIGVERDPTYLRVAIARLNEEPLIASARQRVEPQTLDIA